MDFRDLAEKRLPAPMFHYIDGAAEDEWTYRQNTSAFEQFELVPRFLVDVDKIDTSTTVLGQKIDWPFICSPTGYHRLFHPDGEGGAARAAARTGTIFCLSTISTTLIEDVAKASDGPKVFQIYVLKDRSLSQEYIQRCKDANYDALCLTVDVPSNGRRERDLVTGMTVPPKLGLSGYMNIARHINWSFNYITHPPTPSMVNLEHKVPAGSSSMSVMDFMNSQFDRTVTWKDAAWMIEQWDKPFAIKGILSVEDAKMAAEVGASAIMVSNHGGRQLESAPAPVDCIAPIADELHDKLEIICDGGVRRGNHVVKALALGASACSIGRGYLFGLAAGGQKGVEHALGLLKTEVERTMALLGCNSVTKLGRDYVQKR